MLLLQVPRCVGVVVARAFARAGINNWLNFAEVAYGSRAAGFPPTLEGVLVWSNTFRCLGTFGNYLGYLRKACYAVGCDAPPEREPALRQAMCAIAKRQLFTARPRMFIQRGLLQRLVAAVGQNLEEQSFAMLWLVSYTFLLRLPSEALSMCRGGDGFVADASVQSLFWKDGDSVCLQLRSRKNRPGGSGVLRRVCTCRGCKLTCPVHVLWDGFFVHLLPGTRPWQLVGAGTARAHLRNTLAKLGVPAAKSFGTHDFRRGHAQDMLSAGSTLAQILSAGQWKSSAFLQYINQAELEQEVAFEVAIHSDGEEDAD